MKKWVFIPILGLVLVSLYLLGGWRPILTLFGFQIVSVETPNDNDYITRTNNLFSDWKIVVDSWENSPDNTTALKCYQQMDSLANSWDSLVPPDKYREYHSWVSKAMGYELEAFKIIVNTSPDKLGDIRGELTRLWTLKDESLLEANKALP